MELLRCRLLLLLLLAIAACALAMPTHDKFKGHALYLQKKPFSLPNLPNPAEFLSDLPAKFMKSKPVYLKPIVVVKPVIIGGGGGHGHGHGHGHHGKNKLFGKFK